MKMFNVLAVVLGSLIAICLLTVFENLFGMLYFSPRGKLILDHDLFIQRIAHLPASFYLVLMSGNCMACCIGGMVPVIIGDEHIKRSVYIGIIVSVFGILNTIIIPFPDWYQITVVLIIIPFCLLGNILVKTLPEIQIKPNE